MSQMEQSKIETVEKTETSKTESDISQPMDSTGGESDAGKDGNDDGNVDLRNASFPEWRENELKPEFDDDGNSDNANEIDLSQENIDSQKSLEAIASNQGSSTETQNFDYPPNKLDTASDNMREQFEKASEGNQEKPTTETDDGKDSPAPTPPDFDM